MGVCSATIGNNKLMLLVFAVTFSLQVLITQFGGALFNTVPLPLEMWLKIIAIAFTVILAAELAGLSEAYGKKRKRE